MNVSKHESSILRIRGDLQIFHFLHAQKLPALQVKLPRETLQVSEVAAFEVIILQTARIISYNLTQRATIWVLRLGIDLHHGLREVYYPDTGVREAGSSTAFSQAISLSKEGAQGNP